MTTATTDNGRHTKWARMSSTGETIITPDSDPSYTPNATADKMRFDKQAGRTFSICDSSNGNSYSRTRPRTRMSTQNPSGFDTRILSHDPFT